jgi:hypothetical protein
MSSTSALIVSSVCPGNFLTLHIEAELEHSKPKEPEIIETDPRTIKAQYTQKVYLLQNH